MNGLTVRMQEIIDEVDALPVDQIVAAFFQCFVITPENLFRASRLWQRMKKERLLDGEDNKMQRVATFYCLDKIFHGQIVPEVIVVFDKKHRRTVISSLPKDDQIKAANGEKFKLAVYGPEGEETFRLIDASTCSDREFNQVFSLNGVISLQSQFRRIRDNEEVNRHGKPKREQIGFVTVDYERDGIMVSRQFIHFDDLARVYRMLKRHRK